MIGRIIGFSARNRAVVLLVIAALVVLAWETLSRVRLDALPDLSDTQVIVYSKWDRSPDIIEDQVTYPIVSKLLGTSRVKAVRGFSDFGYSFVYAIFQDGTDIGWARSRVLEQLSAITGKLPAGVTTELGPDASGTGWIFQYALVDRTGNHRPDELRAFQDWTLRYSLQALPGVAEVASIGGYERQYQVTVDPVALRAYGLTLDDVADAVRASNDETGGRLIERSGTEFMVRGRGYARTPADFEAAVLRVGDGGIPVRVGDVARVTLGPDLRRGVSDLDGTGDHVSGIVVMRHGENALNVIRRVRERLAELGPSLPAGVEVVTTYDRGDLIERAIDTLRHELTIEMIIVALVILLFLWHIPSAIVPILTIPVAVLLAFIPLQAFGVTINIMSLSGIAISIGVLVDGAIVEVENAYNRLHAWEAGGRVGDYHEVRLRALQEVGPSVFFSLLVVSVSFLPIFALEGMEGRLFHPLAWSKNLAMAMAALLAITLDPALRMLFTRMDPFVFRPRLLARFATAFCVGSYHAEDRHPVSRVVQRLYEPVCRWTLRHPRLVIGGALLLLLVTIPAYLRLGREFMPPLDEGTLLYMPTTLPGISIGEAERLLGAQDRILREFPEVERVFGKAGRAATSTDPAPLSMIETTVVLKPHAQWRGHPRWYSGRVPEWVAGVLRPWWPDRISREELVDELDKALAFPGVTNAWTMPIKARIDMLSTGVRTPVGIKVFGPDLPTIERVGTEIEAVVRNVPGARSVFAERAAGGWYLDVIPDRAALARHGVRLDDLQRTLAMAVGGETIGTVIDGRARFPVNLRYPRELRDDPDAIERVLVATPHGGSIPLGQLAKLEVVSGPAMIRDEGGFLAGYVYVDVGDRDIGGFVDEARARVREHVALPAGTSIQWSGQYEALERVSARLRLIIPLTLGLIALLLYANTRSGFKTALILAVVPFSAIGAVWLFHFLHYDVSIAAWVGMIALFGLDAETAVFMLLFLDLAWDEARRNGALDSPAAIDEAVVHGAVRRIRPKMMTVAAALLGLLPILWSTSAGADVMKRIAAPMIGGLITSFAAELLIYPPVYKLWKRRGLRFDRNPGGTERVSSPVPQPAKG